MNRTTIGAILALVLLAACQEQKTVILEQSSSANLANAAPVAAPARPARPTVVLSPCTAPAGTGPFERLTKPVSSSTVFKPPRALAEHVKGCAGVRFRIGPNGAPQDIVVMAEYPAGYGFGDTAFSAVSVTRWPARDDLSWHYLIIYM